MGKKVMKEASSLQIIARKNNHLDKNKLNSLIKVLKPKVYITDSASFKNLVQELTGNGTSPLATLPPPPPPPEKFRSVIDIDHDDVIVGPDSSMENSSGGCSPSSSSSSSELCNMHASFTGELSGQVAAASSEEAFFPLDTTVLDNFPGNPGADAAGFEEMESWLLQIDPLIPAWSDINGYCQSFEEVAAIYDQYYDLACLI